MKARCLCCNRTIPMHIGDKRRYLDFEYIPTDWKTTSVKIHAFKCPQDGIFYVAYYLQVGDDGQLHPQKHVVEKAYWNQGHKTKIPPDVYKTTNSEYSDLISSTTDKVSAQVLKREKKFFILYPAGTWDKDARESRQRNKHAQKKEKQVLKQIEAALK